MNPRLIILGLFLFAASAWGQSDRGTITGTVTDQGGAVVPNAAISAVNVETSAKFETATTGTGNYTLSQLPAGEYNLSAGATGFSTFVQKGIRMQVAQTARIDVLLKVGAATESVNVTADAPLLKTESAEQSTNISIQRFNELPLYGNGGGGAGLRSPWAFTNIMPGASVVPNGGNSNLRVNGLQNDTFRVMIDGQDATFTQQPTFSSGSQPSVEALEEVSLQTSNFAAEYGQVGGGLFNFTSKSGTNKFHGSGFEYFRNEALNAGQPFTNGGNNTLLRPVARSHNFGFTFGGPVVLPRLYDGRNKTFFFVSLENAYSKTTTTNTQTLPTLAYRNGDFSAARTGKSLGTDVAGRPIIENTVYDPQSQGANGLRDAFPGNIIPVSRLDPVALKIQALMPQPHNAAAVNNYQQSYVSPSTAPIFTTKLDENFGANSKLSFYLSFRLNDSPWNNADGLPIPITGSRAGTINTPTFRMTYNQSLTPTMLLNIGVGFVRHKQQDAAQAGVLEYDALGKLGLYSGAKNSFTGVASTGGFPRITGLLGANSGGMSLNMGPANANFYYGEKPTGVASLTWIHENHTIKFGAEWRKDAHADRNVRGSQGIFAFTSQETALPSNQTLAGGTVGFPYASFLLGLANNASINAPQDPMVSQTGFGAFLQDNWKITRKLTLDYGLRWDYTTALSELWDRQQNFAPTLVNPAAGGLRGGFEYQGKGAGRCNCNFAKSYPWAFQPRLGAAYQINSKTVIRAGWGLSYTAGTNYGYITNQPYLGVGINQLAWVSPAYGLPAVNFRAGLPYTEADLYKVTLDPGARPGPGLLATVPYWLDPQGGRPGRVNQWNISLQRELGRNLVVEASYVGNRGAWFQANALNNLNAVTPSRLQAAGLNITSSSDLSLLTQPLSSAAVQARGFKAPYAGYPLTSSLAQSLRPFPQFTNIPALWSPLGNSWYDSLQAKATKRFSHGLDFTLAYTWQKELSLGTDGGGNVNDFTNRPNQKTVSNSSVPMALAITVTYQTPKYGPNRLVRSLTGDWSLGGVFKYQSGLPILVPGVANNALSQAMFQNTFANRVPGVPLYLKDLNCHCFDPNTTVVLNPAAWTQPTVGTFGTSSMYYNDYRSARRPTESLALSRFFTFHEGIRLEIRAMFFNPFNRVYLNNPTSTNALATTTRNAGGQLTGGFGWINNGSTFAGPRNGMMEARFQF